MSKDDWIYHSLWIVLAVLGGLFLLWYIPLGQPPLPACWFYTRCHIYCPGCGGTRAVEALLRGRILQAVWYHPAVPFAAVSIDAYLASQSIWRLRVRRGMVLRYSDKWLRAFILLLAVNCLTRNLLWFGFHISL